MIDPVLPGAFAAGAGLGGAYLWLLWRGTAALAGARTPGRTALAGAGLRIALVAGGLWVIGAGAPLRLLVALAGFLLVRQLAVRHVRRRLQARRHGAMP